MVKSFEGARGLAAVIVALFHLKIGSAMSLIGNGYLLVDLFFVLSGYVICSAYSERLSTSREIRAFALRRFGRLFPLLIFSSLCFVAGQNLLQFGKFLALELGHGAAFKNPEALAYLWPSAAELLAIVTMTQGLGLFDRLILNYVNWSISTEFYTYLLFAGCCSLLQGAPRRIAFVLLSIAGMAAAIWATVALHACLRKGMCLDVTYDFGLARCIASFFLGALLVELRQRLTLSPGRLQLLAMAAAAAFFYAIQFAPAVALLSPLLFALVVLALAGDTGFGAALLNSRPLQIIGQRSYSIYMMHPFLLLFFGLAVRPGNGIALNLIVLGAYLATLVVVSGWTYRWIEDPSRNFFNRLAAAYARREKDLAGESVRTSSML